MAVAMAWLHPHQQVYFNLLVDRSASGGLAQRYDMEDYRSVSRRQALEYLRARHPDAMLHVHDDSGGITRRNRRILPELDRRHIVLSPAQQAEYHIGGPLSMSMGWMPSASVVHAFRAYGDAYAYLLVVGTQAGLGRRPFSRCRDLPGGASGAGRGGQARGSGNFRCVSQGQRTALC